MIQKEIEQIWKKIFEENQSIRKRKSKKTQQKSKRLYLKYI